MTAPLSVTIERIDLDTDAVSDRIKRGIDTVADRDAAMAYARNILRRSGMTEFEIEQLGKPRPVSLYRHFDDKGCLLYVGVSLDAIARLAAHRRVSRWYDHIYRIEIERHPTRDAALAAERTAIRAENPLHNIAGRAAGRAA